MAVTGKASIRTLYSGTSSRRHHSCRTTATILHRRALSSSAALMIVLRLRQTAPTQNRSSTTIGSALISRFSTLCTVLEGHGRGFPPRPCPGDSVDVFPLLQLLDAVLDGLPVSVVGG